MKNKNQLYDIKILSNPLIKDPIFKIISNFDDIKNIYTEGKYRNKKIFYFSREKIHKILHDLEICFYFEEDQDLNDISKNLSELFYLSLLVLNNGEYDYKYSFNYIKLIYDYLKNENNIKQYKKIIISKILDSIIENYKDIDEYEHNNEYDFKNKKAIEEMEIFIQKNLNDFGKKSIDIIYLEVIISLIKNYRFNDYQYCFDIIRQLDLENIDITPTIFDGLSKILNSDEEYMKYYIIKNYEDIKNETKINFYYILIIFILKNSIYIYNIEFLYNNIKYLRKIKKEISISFEDTIIQVRIKEILKYIEVPNSFNNTVSLSDNSFSQNYSLNFSSELLKAKNDKNDNKDFVDSNSFNNSEE